MSKAFLFRAIGYGLLILLSNVACFDGALKAQCPDNKILLTRLFDSSVSTLSTKEKLGGWLSTLDSLHKCPSVNDSAHAFLLRRIGALYFVDANYLKAAAYYREFIQLVNSHANKPTVDMKNLVAGYYWLSVMYDSLNLVTSQMKALDSCIDISAKLNYIDPATLMALYAKLEYYFDVGDYYTSIEYATRCRTMANQYAAMVTGEEHEKGVKYESSSLLWSIKAMLILKDYAAAEKALSNKYQEYKKPGLENYLGTIYGQLAEVELSKENYEKAMLFYQQALSCHQRAGDYFKCKQVLNSIGYDIYFSHYHDMANARAAYRKAMSYVNKDKLQQLADVFESVNLFTRIGNVYAQEKAYDSAQYYFQVAFNQLKPGLNETTVLNYTPDEIKGFKKNYYLSSLVIDKADAYWKQYETSGQLSALHEAMKVYKKADLLIDRIKREQSDLESKLFWRKDSRRLYEHAIAACYASGDAQQAFYFFEKSRSVLLNDQLNSQYWLGENDISLLAQKKKNVIQLTRDLALTSSSAASYSRLQDELFRNNQDLVRLEQQIKEDNPLYYQGFLDTAVVAIPVIQKEILTDHQCLVEFFEADSIIYVMVITANTSVITRTEKKKFDQLTREYIRYLSDPELINRHYDFFVSTSQELYSIIFRENPLPAGRIIISPGGQYFPFEALVTSGKNEPVQYFLSDHAVSYIYSARFLFNHFKISNNNKTVDFMGVAPVRYDKQTALAGLPGSDVSLGRIKLLMGSGHNLIDGQAIRNNFLRQFSAYKIIQLYTHASDSSKNNEPVIYFTDSALYLSDLIPENKPVTQLIVLSACETGNGKVYQGEGVFSFNRAFAALGIPSSVTNLWSVDNQSTYQITELFYKYLSQGLPLDVALQKAKKEFMLDSSKEKSLPYYWAAPILVGKTDPVVNEKPIGWKYLAVAVGILGLAYFGWKAFKRSSRFKVQSSRL